MGDTPPLRVFCEERGERAGISSIQRFGCRTKLIDHAYQYAHPEETLPVPRGGERSTLSERFSQPLPDGLVEIGASDAGRAWLARLPRLLHECADRWQLTLGHRSLGLRTRWRRRPRLLMGGRRC